MERIKCTIGYDGTGYSGFQIQENSNKTIQEKLQRALKKLHKGKEITIVASGRTDAGVHAKGQVFHFDTDIIIPEENWIKAFHTKLPDSIQVHRIEKVDRSFHARYDVKQKEYRYRILNSKEPDVFKRHYTFHVWNKLDVEKMQKACKYIMGTHDFTSFCSMKTGVKGEKVRTIYKADCSEQGDEIIFTFRGDGFLYNMVRILVGTLVEVGKGVRSPEEIQEIIGAKSREKAGKTAPAHGLFLWEVQYG